MIHESVIRAWCETFARRLRCDRIRPDGRPYLDRYYVIGWTPGTKELQPAVYLHHFISSDPQETVHSHPWSAVSLILVGAYREHRCRNDVESVQDYRAGDVNFIEPTDRHRVELLTEDVWTLLVRGPYVQDWTFFPACPS